MSAIEPMTVGEIKQLLGLLQTVKNRNPTQERLILAWANAEARARSAEFWGYHKEYAVAEDCVYCRENYRDGIFASIEKHRWEPSDWLAAVKREIGWPDQSE